MPTSSRVTTSSRVMGAATGDKSASSNSNGNCVDNKHGDIPQQEDTRELSTTTAIATFTTAVSSATNDSIASLKVKEEHTDSISDTIGNGNRGDDHDLSAFSSLHSERDSSKVAPTSSTPSRNTATPRSDFLSPPPSSVNPSNYRAEYDDCNFEMGFNFDEASPPRDFAGPSPRSGPTQEPIENNATKKRGSSELDQPSSVKRSNAPHHRYHSHLPEGPSLYDVSSSTPGTGVSPGYHNIYGYNHPLTPYHGENRTPGRSNPQHGGYHSGPSPYYPLLGQLDFRSALSPRLGTPKTTHPTFESAEDTTPSPPSSPGARTLSKPVQASTPEKGMEKIPAKSPSRSPRMDPGCVGSESNNNETCSSSPFFKRPNYSFEMDTPSGTLPTADLSPMGPSFEDFHDNSTPFRSETFFLGNNFIGIHRSPSHGNSDGTPSPSSSRRERRSQRSLTYPDASDPLSFDQSNTMHGESRPYSHYDYHRDISSKSRYHSSEGHCDGVEAGIRKHLKASAVTMSGRKGEPPSSRLDPGAQPKQLWPSTTDICSKERRSSNSGVSGPVRLEIGGTGSLSTRKTLEGINSMMQQSSTSYNKGSIQRNSAVSGYGTTRGRVQPAPQHHRSSHHSYSFGELATPSKGYSHMRSGHGRGRHNSYQPPVGPGMKPMYSQKADHSYSARRPSKPIYMSHHPPRDGNSLTRQHNHLPSSVGKENNKKKAAPKRNSCNCKKSKCLKLYCECFAAERFCNGCNCVDCRNTPEFEEDRQKAITDTRAKNSKAFQQKIVGGAESTQKVHNMGCKCKKSQCLKKYCECFNAGVFCGAKCKCTSCMNYAGSQQLADKRNKMKDPVGAHYALRVSHEQWKSGSSACSNKPSSQIHRPRPTPSPVIGMPRPHHMVHPSPRGYQAQRSHGYPPPQHPHGLFIRPMIPHGHHSMGYPPMGLPPGYHRPPHRMPPGEGLPQHGMYRASSHSSRPLSSGKLMTTSKFKDHTKTSAGSPRTPGVRKPFDPATNRKKRKVTPGELEPTEPYFGDNIPEQPKITGLAVFSFLSNDDLYHASLVCKSWSKLAMDEELWKFQ